MKRPIPPTDHLEWLEADGLGGFASGTASGVRTRRYHGLLLTATRPPVGRMMLVNGFDAWVTRPASRFAISSQRYTPDVVHPDGAGRIESFTHEPWPCWVYRLDDGSRVQHEVFAVRGQPLVIVSWRLLGGSGPATLEVRPLVSGRDYHSTHHENDAIDLRSTRQADGTLTWRPYEGVPPIRASANGRFDSSPLWYRNFLYTSERARGLDAVEDLASPGVFTWDLASGDACWVLSTDRVPASASLLEEVERFCDRERTRRANYPSRLHASADTYIVRRGRGRTIIAGYPWFTDWGRDTFIALPGLCLATGRLDAARDVLLEWSDAVSEGMVPNRFPDQGEDAEFNAVDASLWCVIAIDRFLAEASRTEFPLSAADRRRLDDAVLAIVGGYHRGTRHGIRADADGLLAAGSTGMPLTWMDARVDGRAVTPRVGKPVEVQALWINALASASARDASWSAIRRHAQASFDARFWNDVRGCLYDVVDVDHVPGRVDASLRPNQIFAVGGLPLSVVAGARAGAIVDLVELHLLTPLGLRTLAPGEPGYIGTYEGGVESRDAAYHQGTAWPWLLYAFGEACCRTRPADRASRDLARITAALRDHLTHAGLGHVSELAGGNPPHAPGGCPFQAWSIGALLQIEQIAAMLRVTH
jgi:predicted glycogen debranching enzyme